MNRWAAFLIVAFIAAVLLSLTGCEPAADRRVMVLIDTETGCQYLGRANDNGIKASYLHKRIGADGKQVCK